MNRIPVIPASALTIAKSAWDESIEKFGRLVTFESLDGSRMLNIRAFCKRPKIMGLFDRGEQSYDQTRFLVLVKAQDLAGFAPSKFDRIVWDDEEHAVLSVTQVDLLGTVFGYRILVKG